MSTLASEEIRAIEAACAVRLEELEHQVSLRDIADIRAFCDALARRRGRPLTLVSSEMPADPAALWVAMGQCDYIVYEERAAPPYQEHLILHEVGHMLCGHTEPKVDLEYLRQHVVRGLDPDLIRGMLGRIGYDTRDEHEAELLASLIEQRWRHLRRLSASASPLDHESAPSAGETRQVQQNLTDYAAKLRVGQSAEPR